MHLYHSFLSFQVGRSFLHAADARIKLACLIAWEVMIWYVDLRGTLFLLGAVFLLYALSRVSLLRACEAMKFILILACAIFVIPLIFSLYRHGLTTFLQTALRSPVLYSSAHYAFRLCTIALVAHLFTTTTPVGRLVDVLEWCLLPWKRFVERWG